MNILTDDECEALYVKFTPGPDAAEYNPSRGLLQISPADAERFRAAKREHDIQTDRRKGPYARRKLAYTPRSGHGAILTAIGYGIVLAAFCAVLALGEFVGR